MRNLIFIVLLMIVVFHNNVKGNIFDSLAFDIALNLNLHPFKDLEINIGKKDLIINTNVNHLTNSLRMSLSSYCKSIVNNENIDFKLFWIISPDINKKSKLNISAIIIDKNKIIYRSKNYFLENSFNYKFYNLEKIEFKNRILEKILNSKPFEWLEEYSFIDMTNDIAVFHQESFKKLLVDIYGIKFKENCDNLIQVNYYGDLVISGQNRSLILKEIFPLRYCSNHWTPFLYYVKSNDLILKLKIGSDFYNEFKDEDIFKYKNVLFPNNMNFDSLKYIWKKSDDFKFYYSRNGTNKLTFREFDLAIVKDNLESQKYWKVSNLVMESKTMEGNLDKRYMFYSIKDYYKYNDDSINIGDNHLLFINYLKNKDLLFNEILKNTEHELKENLLKRVSGIHWDIKELIIKIIIEYTISSRSSFAAL